MTEPTIPSVIFTRGMGAFVTPFLLGSAVLLSIGDEEWWWLLALFVPFVNVYALYRMVAGGRSRRATRRGVREVE